MSDRPTPATAVCSSCGTVLSRADDRCPGCGLEISWGVPGAAPSQAFRCPVCGYGNTPGEAYCQSCGARLPKSAPEPRQLRKVQRPPAETTGVRSPGMKFEPWQIVSAVAVVLLIAFLIYNEATRQESRMGGTTAGSAASPATQPSIDLKPLEEAVKASPNDPAALLRLANALHDAGALPRAIEIYGRYLAIKPRDPDARVDMGSCFYQMGLLDTANAGSYFARALTEMNRAHVDNPTHQPAVFNMGVVNLQMGNLEESNRWFREAVKVNPGSDLGKRAQQMLDQHSFTR